MPGARDTNSDVTADAIWGRRAVVSAERWSSANRPVAAALVTGVRVSYVGDAAKRRSTRSGGVPGPPVRLPSLGRKSATRRHFSDVDVAALRAFRTDRD